jgi:predicted ArsR family transcriptional regulator
MIPKFPPPKEKLPRAYLLTWRGLPQDRRVVLDLLLQRGPLTARQIVRLGYESRWEMGPIRSRLSELVQQNLVEKQRTRSLQSKRSVFVYRAVRPDLFCASFDSRFNEEAQVLCGLLKEVEEIVEIHNRHLEMLFEHFPGAGAFWEYLQNGDANE